MQVDVQPTAQSIIKIIDYISVSQLNLLTVSAPTSVCHSIAATLLLLLLVSTSFHFRILCFIQTIVFHFQQRKKGECLTL